MLRLYRKEGGLEVRRMGFSPCGCPHADAGSMG